MSTLVGGAAPQMPIPRNEEVKAYFYQNAIIGETRRMRQIDRYESFYAGRQYAHQQYDWWGLSADQTETISSEVQVPLGFTQPAMALNVRQKRPTAPYNLAKAVVDRFTGLLFSDARRPDVSIEGDPDTEDFLKAVIEQSRLWPKLREARTVGGSTGSVLVTSHIRNGGFILEVHNPKHLMVVWKDRRTLTPKAVLKLYRYKVEEDVVDTRTGEFKGVREVDYLYRRIITDVDDTVFKDVKLEPGVQLAWDPESVVTHDLGFFPGVWIQNLPVPDSVDGAPDCHGAWQNFDTMDRLLAQMNKAVLLNLDPTLVVSVDPKIVDAQGGLRKGSDTALMVGLGGNANYLEITGSGIEAGMKVYSTLKQNTLDVVRCVLVDPSTISGAAQSAKAIEYIYAPMLEKADDLRSQYGDLGVVPLMRLIEAMARKYDGQSMALPPDPLTNEERVGRFTFALPPKTVVTEDGTRVVQARKLGPGGYIRLKWGPYFSPTETDKQTAIANLIAAKGGGLLDSGTAVAQGAPVFGVQDAVALLKRINDEKEQEQERMMAGYPGFAGEPPMEQVDQQEVEPSPPAGEGGRG